MDYIMLVLWIIESRDYFNSQNYAKAILYTIVERGGLTLLSTWQRREARLDRFLVKVLIGYVLYYVKRIDKFVCNEIFVCMALD
jgi:hypothetical protein